MWGAGTPLKSPPAPSWLGSHPINKAGMWDLVLDSQHYPPPRFQWDLGVSQAMFTEGSSWKWVFQRENRSRRLFPSRSGPSVAFPGEEEDEEPLPPHPTPHCSRSLRASIGTPQKYDPTFKGPIYDR